MMFCHRFCGHVVRGVIIAFLLAAGTASGQDYSSAGISDLVAAADFLLQRGDFKGAIPALKEVVERTQELEDSSGKQTCQNCRFQLARAYYQTGSFTAGMGVLKTYLETNPRKKESIALRMLAQGYFENGDWENAKETTELLLNKGSISREDVNISNLILGQALFRLEEWDKAVAPLTHTANSTDDKQIKRLCEIMIVRAMVEAENWRELYAWIPRLYRTDAKYDIALNLTLMKAGKARYEDEDYLNALVLYRKVLDREVLTSFSERRVAALAKKLASDIKAGIRQSDIDERQSEINDLKESLKTLKELPAYQDEVTFRIGQVYAETARYWEAFVLFEHLYQRDRTSDIGEASLLQSVLILYEIGEIERAESRVRLYLDEKSDGDYARALLSMVMRDNLLEQKNFDKVVKLGEIIRHLPDSQDKDQMSIQADLHFMLAFGHFQRKDYARAEVQFTEILEKFINSAHAANTLYYRGMTYMLQGGYASALADFKSYQNANDNADTIFGIRLDGGGEHFPESIFREGVCYFGLNRIPEAEATFTKFIDAYKDDQSVTLVSEAYSMRGDIEAAKSGEDDPNTPEDEYDPNTLDRSLSDYRMAIDKAVQPAQASYAAFQAAKVYKLEFKWQEIIDLMTYYMERWEDQANIAEAVFWIGQSQINLDQTDEAIQAYVDAIQRFGNDSSREGVDKIILELVNIARYRIEDEEREDLAYRFKAKAATVDEKLGVLALRLRIIQAMLESEEAAAALGDELLSDNQDLETASPLGLAILCDAAVRAGDMKKMEYLSGYFVKKYDESSLLWQAYRASATKWFLEKNYEEVLKVVNEAQGLYGVDKFMGWAQLLKADTLYAQEQYEEAEKAYNVCMGVSEWRGPIFAEAMFGMGNCRVAQQDYAAAHSFFQRTYLLFKGYSGGDWAAKGYLAAVDVLIKMGKISDAVRTAYAMLDDDYTRDHATAKQARDTVRKYGSKQ